MPSRALAQNGWKGRDTSQQVIARKPKYGFKCRLSNIIVWGGGFATGGVRFFEGYILTAVPVISIIDDDASVRAATNNLLRSVGYTAHTFASAEAFLHSAQLNETWCAIVDVQMPTMSGIELQSYLRANGYRVPFIFITAFPEESVCARALRDGAIGFLAKPFDGDALIRCINTALECRGSRTSE
jgi:CheY-like chemotaxis protein